MFRTTFYLFVVSFSSLLSAQEPKNLAMVKGTSDQPAAAPSEVFHLLNVMSAKLSDDGTRLVLMAPKKQAETRTQTVEVTRMVTETRTAVVEAPGGKTVEKTYQVKVPITEQIEQQYVVYAITGMQRHEMDLAAVRAWRLSGESLDQVKLAEWLKAPRKVFAVERPLTEKFAAPEPFYAEMMKADAVMIYLAPGALAKSAVDK